MSTFYPLTQPNFEATVPVSFARNWEIFVRPRGGSEDEEVQVYGDEGGATKLSQPLFTGPTGRIGEGEQFGWIEGSDLPVDLWGRPKGRDDIDWQVLPEGDQAIVVGGVVAEELKGKADLEDGKLKESQLPDSVVSVSSAFADSRLATVVSPLTFGAKFDGRLIGDAAIESGHKTLTASELTAADVGKVILVEGAGVGGATLLTTIASAGTGTATLAVAASATVTGKTALYATDDSAAWSALAASLTPGRGYRITCPEGRSFFNGVVFGSSTSQQGLTLEFVGAGRRATFLQPFSASGAATMLTHLGPGDSTGVGFVATGLTIGMDFDDPIVDLPYTSPIVRLSKVTNYDIHAISRWYGTGTIYKLDGSYEGTFGSGRMQTGRYAVGIETNDEVEGSLPQEDTLRFGETFTHQGNYGIVARNIGHGLDSVVFPQFKSAVYTPSTEGSRTTNGHPDREFFGEGKLAEEAVQGSTTLKLEAGQAAALGYETANLPLPVMIDYGDHVEINKVIAATGDTLTLAQPLQWAHAAAIPVVRGTCAINLATNVQSVTIGDGCHMEGHSCAAVQVAGGKLITMRGVTSASRVAMRLCGGTINAEVARVLMVGAPLLPGGQPRNIAIEVPAWNTSTSLARLSVTDLEKGSSAEEITLIRDTGSNLNSVYWETVEVNGKLKVRTRNVPTAQAGTTIEKELVNGVPVWTRSATGEAFTANTGVGSVEFVSNSAGSKGSPGIKFTDAQESPKSLYLSKTDNTQLSVKNNENVKHVTFDVSLDAIILGSAIDMGIRRQAAGVGVVTTGAKAMGTLAFAIPDVNSSGKTSAEITTAVEAITGTPPVKGMRVSDETNHLTLQYSGTKWFKTAAATEIA